MLADASRVAASSLNLPIQKHTEKIMTQYNCLGTAVINEDYKSLTSGLKEIRQAIIFINDSHERDRKKKQSMNDDLKQKKSQKDKSVHQVHQRKDQE